MYKPGGLLAGVVSSRLASSRLTLPTRVTVTWPVSTLGRPPRGSTGVMPVSAGYATLQGEVAHGTPWYSIAPQVCGMLWHVPVGCRVNVVSWVVASQVNLGATYCVALEPAMVPPFSQPKPGVDTDVSTGNIQRARAVSTFCATSSYNYRHTWESVRLLEQCTTANRGLDSPGWPVLTD
jgi:hypothetical protein